MNRREVIRRIAVGSTTILILPLAFNSCEKNTDDTTPEVPFEIDLNDAANSNLNNTDGYIITNDIIVVNAGNGNFIALSAICTHMGCTVSYNSSAQNFPCPCHGSVFDLNGNVVQGPATLALQKYTVTQSGSALTIAS
jgi:cytochrome b6-f complex iron-sulfur subunit